MAASANVIEDFVAMVRAHGDAPVGPAGLTATSLFFQQRIDKSHHICIATQMLGLHEGAIGILGDVAQVREPDPVREADGVGSRSRSPIFTVSSTGRLSTTDQ